VIATASVARLKLTARELADLNPGDLLLTDTSATAELSFEVDGRPIFRGSPGQSENRKVICLTKPVAHDTTSAEQST
jgi:flagellar motor switch protein FliM